MALVPGSALRSRLPDRRIVTARRFDGVLPWGQIDNRPFLRCMHGFGLCLWLQTQHAVKNLRGFLKFAKTPKSELFGFLGSLNSIFLDRLN
jgi:hypothetical protein